MKSNWILAEEKSKIIIDQLLLNRGVDLKKKDKFLYPDFTRDLLNPLDLHDMKKACQLIKTTIDKGEKIGIFGDYDADGVPGAAILAKLVEIYGGKYGIYIPKRNEGYGLNKNGIDKLIDEECKLLITVDLGITGKKEVKYAKKRGLKIIITDHHEIQKDKFPDDADAVVHTHLSKKYQEKNLCGAAVAYKIVQAMMLLYDKPSESQFKWISDLVCISTICDIVSLEGENRVLAKYGLIALSKTKNLGLNKLFEVAKIDKKSISTYTVGFQIGPRINAPGRIEHASASFWLLVSDDDQKVQELANKLDSINIKRQEDLKKAVEEAQEIIIKNNLDKEHIILFKGKNWPGGIVGLISSEITKKYNRPSIVFTKEDGILRGSGRSIDEFDLVENLKKFDKYLHSFGGHKKAAGVSIKIDKWDKFYTKITNYAKQVLDKKDLVKKINIDMQVASKDINFSTFDEIKKLEPFGLGNPKPVFLLKNMNVVSLRWVGRDEKHLQMQLKNEKSEKNIKSIMFGVDKKNFNIKTGSVIDVVFNLDENVWNGKRYLDLKIIDYDKVGML